MRTFRKYEFVNADTAKAAITALGEEHPHSVVELGHIVETPGDEENPPVMSTTYHVDVLWKGEVDPSWDDHMIWCPPMGLHVFGSSSAIKEWTETCKRLHPEYFPEPEEE